MLKDKLAADLKQALLARDSFKVDALKNLKSAILYEEVAQKVRDKGLTDEQIQIVVAREAKKRAESAEMYTKAGADDRAKAELAEKEIIDAYLPKPISDSELQKIVDDVIATDSSAQMGQVIGAVRAKVGPTADGARIAAMVKAKLGA